MAIVDECNPQALQLLPGSYLKIFRYTTFYAQIGLSACIIAAFTTAGWQEETDERMANLRFKAIGAAVILSFASLGSFVAVMDLLCQICRGEQRRLLSERATAYTAFVDSILRLLCFLAISPLERFYDTEKTSKPSWYDWLG